MSYELSLNIQAKANLVSTSINYVLHINIEINKRRLRYVGHAVRHKKTSLMSTVLMGKIEGKRKRGRPAKNLVGNLIEASRFKGLQEMVECCREREDWRKRVASCMAPTVDSGDGDR